MANVPVDPFLGAPPPPTGTPSQPGPTPEDNTAFLQQLSNQIDVIEAALEEELATGVVGEEAAEEAEQDERLEIRQSELFQKQIQENTDTGFSKSAKGEEGLI